ncbi:hypothetical protein CRE_22155 [Caenorhabditis remanei]|uniref:Serpentine receptor class r-10 n=1 Tax=Caenorhabditis remanei TaxID=31234 RepID=E3NJ06_CAERE|nr:hypothetical protein CRE_22155 [Caenorhabditis remanei]
MLSTIISQVFTYLLPLLSWVCNAILIFLILQRSPQALGGYKYLMLIFSVFGVAFGVINVTSQPKLHFYQAAYIIFSENPLGLPRKVSFWYLALNCAMYAMTLYLLAFHFVYRYLAVCKPHKLQWFTYPYFLVMIGIFLMVTFDWWFMAVWLAGEDEEVEEYISDSMRQTFNLTCQDYTYAASLFYRKNPINGMESASLPDFLFVLNLVLIITSGFSIITYCWFKLHTVFINTKIHFHFRPSQSRRTLEMQHQLFRSLVAQTLFPVFLLFFPAGVLLGFPIFKFEPGPLEAMILPLIATEPVIDSLVPMYFIKDYRKAIRGVFRKGVGAERSTTMSPGNARVHPM